MITRTNKNLVVEGFFVSQHAPGENAKVRLRVEIEGASGIIQSIGEARGSGDLVLGEDHLILPGFIDLHVHAREDVSKLQMHKETYASAGQAAIHGGVTAFADMPNNPAPPIDDASYAAKHALAKKCPVDVLLYAAVAPRGRPLTFPVPYKLYMAESIGDTYFESEEVLRDTLPRYRGLKVAFHAEAPEILNRHRNASSHARRRPPEAEVRAIETAIRVSESFQIEPHICHLSTADGLEVIRAARRRGMHVSCEVAPHHLYYDQDNVASFGRPLFLQTNPPIRSRLDRIALLEAFKAGEIDCLASDHAPHTLEEKERGISGMPHLDTYGAFVCWLHAEGVPWQTLRLACAERPGKLLSRYLPALYGKVEKGHVGSLTILREEPETVRRNVLRTRAGWSPFEGCTFPGRVSHTIVRGKIYPRVDD